MPPSSYEDIFNHSKNLVWVVNSSSEIKINKNNLFLQRFMISFCANGNFLLRYFVDIQLVLFLFDNLVLKRKEAQFLMHLPLNYKIVFLIPLVMKLPLLFFDR